MRISRQWAWVVPLAAGVLIGAHSAPLKDPIGVYAVIDRMVFEPGEAAPDRVQIWGVFRMSRTFEVENGKIKSIDLSAFRPTQRGYLYYTLNPANESGTRREWVTLESAVGTGKEIGFGSRIPPDAQKFTRLPEIEVLQRWERYNGRVRSADEALAQPDTFPLRAR